MSVDESRPPEAAVDAREVGGDGPDPPGRRTLATALTPVYGTDLLAGVASQARGRGRTGFREAVRSTVDGECAATYASYRRALAVAFSELAAADDRDRQTVLVPAFCSSDLAHAIEGVGLSVRRYDVHAHSLAADLASLRSRPVGDPLAVVAANVLGYASDVAALEGFCEENDCFLVETLGYAFGSRYRGRRLGTYGDVSVLNFQQGKPIPVGGGLVVSRTPEVSVSDAGRPAASPNVATLAGYSALGRPRAYDVYARLQSLVRRRDQDGPAATTHPTSKTDVRYDSSDGSFATMSNFQCAVGKRVLERQPVTRQVRARTADYYRDSFSTFEYGRPIEPLDGLEDHQWVRFGLLVESNELRTELHRTLAKHGVEAPPLYDWPKVRHREFPGARALQRRILPLPTHPYVEARDRERIVDVVFDVAAAYADRV